jgi:hypothetical protein
MLAERVVKEVKYLIINRREVDRDDDQKIYGGIVYKQILVDAKLKIRKEG